MGEMYFREHRGSFEESMKTIRKIDDINELGNFEIKPYGYDARLQSETQIVLQDGFPIGFITERREVI